MPLRLLPTLLLCACAAELPWVDEYPHVEMTFVDSRADLPAACEFLRHVYAVDGLVAGWRYAYEGTQGRALFRLKSEAVRLRATHVVLDADSFGIGTPIDEAKGLEFRVEGEAFRCPGGARRITSP